MACFLQSILNVQENKCFKTGNLFGFYVCEDGTRIIYERKFLLELRNSPLSRTPPQNLPPIPGVTCDNKVKPASPKDNGVPNTESENDKNDDNHVDREEEPQFEMDI